MLVAKFNGVRRVRIAFALMLFGGILTGSSRQTIAQEKDSHRLSADEFANAQKLIKPQPGESRWMEVPWFLDLHEARQKAAAEGKMLFIYSSGGATGIGSC